MTGQGRLFIQRLRHAKLNCAPHRAHVLRLQRTDRPAHLPSPHVKVLVITTKSPYPLNEGRALRSYNLMREMARQHELHLLSFVQDDLDVQGIDALREFCAVVQAVPLYLGRSARLQLARDVLVEPVSGLPLQVLKYWTAPMRAAIAALRSRHQYDMVHLDMLHLGAYLEVLGDLPVLLMEHNVESQILARRADNQTSAARRAYLRYQQRKLEAYEAAVCRRADTVVAVSEPDVIQLEALTGRNDVVCVPNGVDTRYFQPAVAGAPAQAAVDAAPTLIYVGGFTWFPNLDAIDYFRREILPLVHARRPGVKVKVIGRYPEAALVDEIKADPSVELCGLVDDIRPHVHAAAVYIVPLRIGGGTRLKILDALAMGKAIVSTSIGCEGLEIEHGRNIVVADTPQAFADEVLALLGEPARAAAIGQAGRERVLERYDWSAVGRGLALAYEATVRRGSARLGSDSSGPPAAAANRTQATAIDAAAGTKQVQGRA
jgi:sugar transferase (PEP-CTERM/EpsH1 system associated)